MLLTGVTGFLAQVVFERLLADVAGDLPRFYARVRELARLPRAERDAALR